MSLQPMAQPCTLTRRAAGSPIACETIDIGPTGMRLTTVRPLAVDELLAFDLLLGGLHIDGNARVIREERPHVYALRFDRLTAPMTRRLQDAVTALAATE